MSKFYTGVGSRETPAVVLDLMREMARIFAGKGLTLRSGAADGADQAFELGWLDWHLNARSRPDQHEPRAELYLPWDGFNKHGRDGCFGANIVPELDCKITWEKAREIARSIHPAWDSVKKDGTPVMGRGPKALHTRNVYQVLGQTLDEPSRFLVGYAKLDKQGNPKGGTATAMKLAERYGVTVYNLYKDEHFMKFDEYVRQNS
ncbi:DprA-like DNA recombination-mediator protein [Pseudomonas phage vB_PpuM-Amme-3]|uniref:DprA-like DNA recombination-mediator protein n=2 Tax=Tartuvirus TaxID=3424912 RepID=A0AAX4MWZ2_9CAUD